MVEETVDLTLLDKCSQFCSKHKGELYDDVSINIHNTIDIQDDKKTIECNTKEQIRNCFMEIKNIAFEKLNDLEFKNTIQVHDLVWQGQKKIICVFTVTRPTLIFASDPMHFYTEFG